MHVGKKLGGEGDLHTAQLSAAATVVTVSLPAPARQPRSHLQSFQLLQGLRHRRNFKSLSTESFSGSS